MKTIQNKNHQLESYELNKVSLSCFGDKRYIHEDGIKSYPYGQRKIWRHDNMQQLWQSTYKCHNLHKQCRASSSPTREKPLFQFWRVRNHYFNSDEWETTVVVWNKLVSIWVSFTSQELISCTMHQTLADWSKKNHATIMWPQNNRNAMNRFPGKTPWCIASSTSSFSENVTQW